MGIWLGPISNNSFLQETDFSFTGTYTYKSVGNRWEVAFTSSGTLILNTPITVEMCLVAGGQSGVAATNSKAGNGGNGGEVKTITVTLEAGTVYAVVIGESDKDTSIGDWIATSGNGAAGGELTNTSGQYYSGVDGDNGTYAFNDADTLIYPGVKFGPGAGSGSKSAYYATGLVPRNPGNGGDTNGSKGGTYNKPASSPPVNSGSGGGGGGLYIDYTVPTADPGHTAKTARSAGSTGIAFMRG